MLFLCLPYCIVVLSLQTNFLYNSHSEKVILIDEGRKCACGSIPTIEKVGKKTPWSCTLTFWIRIRIRVLIPDPLDPDPHQNPMDPNH